MKKLKNIIFNFSSLGLYKKIKKPSKLYYAVEDLRELILNYQNEQRTIFEKNPLNKFGKKCFSQTDEDGITIEILKRIGILHNGTFAEFGPGNGMENNTLLLKSLGWKGFWVGNENLKIDTSKDQSFFYMKEFITIRNIIELVNKAKTKLNLLDLDVISMDLDGNDYHLLEELLKNKIKPKLFIIEYNAKFLPPIKWVMKYVENYIWDGTDYFGASLASFEELLMRNNYTLVCCNSSTGANAFFVQKEFKKYFSDVPDDINKIYVPPRYKLPISYGHKQSIKTIQSLFY